MTTGIISSGHLRRLADVVLEYLWFMVTNYSDKHCVLALMVSL